MNEKETWKPIKNYEFLYEVSNFGRVKSLPHIWVGFGKKIICNTKEKTILSKITKVGYEQVVLCKNGTCKTFLVHRLVAEAFIPNPSNLPQVNHKDENKANNFVYVNTDGTVDIEKSNLEWCTAKYNNNYGSRIEKASNKTKNGKLSKQVVQYTLEGKFVAEYPSIKEASRLTGFNSGNISNCCLGRQKTAYGSIWKYKEAV